MSDTPTMRTGLAYPWLAQALPDALTTLRGHATLLHGAPGCGQFELSLAVASAWLCEHEGRAQHAPACGRCVSCRLIEAGTHPDLMVVLPEALQAALGWSDAGDSDAEERSDKGKTKKLSAEIKVEAIRAVVLFAQQTASRGRGKVVLLHPAEQLNLVAANTLLKTLEEPPGALRFVLCCADVDSLLPTVRSRCQAWRVPQPDGAAAMSWLVGQGVPADEARVLLAACGGQPLTVLGRHEAGLGARTWLSLPKDMAQGRSAQVQGWPLALLVDALQKLCVDLCRVHAGAAPQYFPADALPPSPPLERLVTWGKDLAKARRQADHPWNQALKVESLVLQARQSLKIGR